MVGILVHLSYFCWFDALTKILNLDFTQRWMQQGRLSFIAKAVPHLTGIK
jgi:hypothetical protein